jgi:hypothetical protein
VRYSLWTADIEHLFSLFVNMVTANPLFTFMITYTDSMNMTTILDVLIVGTYMTVLTAGNLCEFIHSTALCVNRTVT